MIQTTEKKIQYWKNDIMAGLVNTEEAKEILKSAEENRFQCFDNETFICVYPNKKIKNNVDYQNDERVQFEVLDEMLSPHYGTDNFTIAKFFVDENPGTAVVAGKKRPYVKYNPHNISLPDFMEAKE